MSIIINGKELTINSLVEVARNNKKIELSSNSIKNIINCRKLVEQKISDGEIDVIIGESLIEFTN